MLKFIRGKGTHVNAERIKLQKELFAFNKTVPHGFPHHPSALSYDSKLGLLAIGTRHGLLRIYGTPGVEFQAQFENDVEIRQIAFVENRAQLVCLCADSSLHLWEINTKDDGGKQIGVLEKVKSNDYFAREASKEGSLKQVTTFTINWSKDVILVGTQSGNTYMIDLEGFELTDQIIYQDVVLQNVPDDYKFNPGSVEVIAEQPLHNDKFLIGYNRGLLVLWDNKTLTAEQFYTAQQQLESVCWLYNGDQFMTSHNDGSYIVWRVTDNLQPSEQPKTPYGPFPCKSISKVIWKTVQNNDDFIIIGGGMPRSSFNDKNAVSIIQGTPERGKQHVLDFTSKVIDFLVIAPRDNDKDADNPSALIVLVEEELVVIDLTHPEWLQFRLPYLSSIHSSAITCCQHYSDVPAHTYDQIIAAGHSQTSGKFTNNDWPINGGRVSDKEYEIKHDLLITGHEDGSVRFWDSSDTSMFHLYTLSTSKYFMTLDDDIAPIDGDEINLNETEEEWPPFRKVGTFDPYSDDPRFAIRKIALCRFTGTLIVAGTAGQVILFDLKDENVEKPLSSVHLNIVVDKDGFVWKGHEQLNLRNGNLKFGVGYQPQTILQLTPPAAVTAITLYSEWGLLAVGTAHGFGLYDYAQQKVVVSKSTLNPNDLASTAGGDGIISRRKSFKKSLRESFRRLRKGRSQRAAKKTPDRASPSSSTPASSSSPTKSFDDGRKSPTKGESGDGVAHYDAKPVERQIEARSPDDSMGSMVRALYIGPAFIVNNTTQTPTLWAGTNAGSVLIYTITLPSEEKRLEDSVSCQLAKELQLKHRAPVIAIQIIDNNGYPIPDSFEIKEGHAKAPSAQGHRVLICSEEQFKMFNLPNLKPLNKFKLTAHEGSRGRRIGIAPFVSKSNEKHIEYCMMCLSNQGDIGIYSIPEFKRQMQVSCTKREDINGISSLVFTKLGEGFYLHSSCEFRRFSLSARRIVDAHCTVTVPEGARPVKPSERRPPIAAASVTNNDAIIEENEKVDDNRDASNEDIGQETPTSGIEESPVNESKDTALPIQNHNNENVNHDSGPIVNGTEEIEERDSHSPFNGMNDTQINDSRNRNELSDNMDITVDSVKDHLGDLTLTDSSNTSDLKKNSPLKNDGAPIINSHDD